MERSRKHRLVVSDEKRVAETWRTTLDRVDIQVPQDGQRIDLVDIDLKAGMSVPELTQKLSQIRRRRSIG